MTDRTVQYIREFDSWLKDYFGTDYDGADMSVVGMGKFNIAFRFYYMPKEGSYEEKILKHKFDELSNNSFPFVTVRIVGSGEQSGGGFRKVGNTSLWG